MQLVCFFEDMAKWLNEEVCKNIKLKAPDNNKNNQDYDVKFVNPVTFPIYVPAKENLPPEITSPIPSICIQLIDGSDNLIEKERVLNLRLCVSCWNPGEHGKEIFYPKEDESALGGVYYNQEDTPSYERNCDGWHDVWNFVELIIKKLKKADSINGWKVVKENGIKYGPFTEEDVIWDYYPYWHSWIIVTMKSGDYANNNYDDLL